MDGQDISRAEVEQLIKTMGVEHQRLEDEDKRQNRRLDKLEESVGKLWELAGAIKELSTNMKNMVEEQKRQGERLASLEKRDGDKWNTAIKCFITAVISGAVAYVFFRLGLKG